MRTVVSIFCMLSIAILLTACNKSDDDGSTGGALKTVGFESVEGTDTVTCYDANHNYNTGSYQVCEWFCAIYAPFSTTTPYNWIIEFDMAPELTDPDTTADYAYGITYQGPCK